jgi:hypothetical protein
MDLGGRVLLDPDLEKVRARARKASAGQDLFHHDLDGFSDESPQAGCTWPVMEAAAVPVLLE